MKRRLLQLLARASLALCVAVGLLWTRSVWRCDAIGWSDSRLLLRLVSSDGRLNFTQTRWINWQNGDRYPTR